MDCGVQVPYFNAPIFLQNKTQVGKVEEVLGTINQPVSLSSQPWHSIVAQCTDSDVDSQTVRWVDNRQTLVQAGRHIPFCSKEIGEM